MEKGIKPVLMTTEQLVSQLEHFMNGKSYNFKFNINYGILDDDFETMSFENQEILIKNQLLSYKQP